MAQVEQLIPNYELLKQVQKDDRGTTIPFFSEFIPECSIGHIVPAMFYDNFYKFDCLSIEKSAHPCPSAQIKNKKESQSLHWWFKQMNDKVNLRYERFLGEERERAESVVEPLTHYLSTPSPPSTPPTPSSFSSWPLQRHAFNLHYDFVPQKRIMF